MYMAKQFKLTQKNYYSHDRPHLSYSQLKTYLKSPALYKLRYIDRTNKLKISDPIKFGKLVDAALTDEETFKKFSISEGKRGLSEAEKEWLVTETIWQNAATLASYIEQQPVWDSPKMNQVILTGTLNETLVCGLADTIMTLPSGNVLLDIKTTSESKMRSAKTWFYHCLDLGYHIQAGLYRELYLQQTGELVDFYHLVACVDSDGMPHAKLFKFEDEMCKQGLDLAAIAIDGIKAGVFDEEQVTWDSTQSLRLNDEETYGDDLQEVFE